MGGNMIASIRFSFTTKVSRSPGQWQKEGKERIDGIQVITSTTLADVVCGSVQPNRPCQYLVR